MFAKLKKKIETDGGLVPALTDSPGKSKIHRDSVTSLPRAGSIQHLGISPPSSVAGDSVSIQDESVSRDEIVSLLQKKSEQCKKLESNISELAALVKDKSKTIERLEITLRLQEEDANKKLLEQKEEFNRFIENHQDEKLKLTKLLGTESALTDCQVQLKSKTAQCSAAEALVERLTAEVSALQLKVSTLESTIQKLKEENRERAELVTSLSKDRAAFEKKLEESKKRVEETQMQVSHVETQLAKLDEEYKSYIRNTELQRKKTNKMLQEKAGYIDQLQERVRTLDQRISGFSLSGDDQLTALQAERDLLEQKLSEIQLELTEARSTLGDTVSLLEDKISRQNAMIAEANERLTASHKIHDQMKENFNKQIEDLENELQKHKSLVSESQNELSKVKSAALDNDTELKAIITSLELQIRELQSSRNIEGEETKSKINHLEKLVAVFADKETTIEVQVCDLKETVNILQNVVLEKNHEIDLLQQKIQDEIVTCSDRSSTIAKLQRHISELQLQYDRVEEARDKLETTLAILENEKGTLLEKIADLEKQIQAQHTISADTKLDLERIIDLKSGNEVELRQKLDSLEQMVKQNEMLKAESGLHVEKMNEMSQTISTLQTQLAEKTRTVKKQEQTLKDLRVTLQRELKVQALPNDDTFDSAHSNGSFTPSMPPRISSHLQQKQRPQELQQFQQLKSLQHHDYQQINSTPGLSGNSTVAAVLSVQASSSSVLTLTAASTSVSSDAALTARTNTVKKELDKDVNFLYLKHVILKFMLSRETEAMQLIKAVSMLLNFTHQEQQLIRDTLEWKMSWFGHRPSLGEGQTAKIAKLQRHISELQLQYDRVEEARDKLETTLAILENEKGTLLEKIADLEKQIQAQHTISADTKLDLERIIDLKSGNEVELRQKLDSLEQMVKQNEMLKAESGLHVEKMNEMSQTISTLQTQLAEKTRTVKKQEQTLKDLRVTLQRELKVQALPNDDTFDSAHSNGSFTPSMPPRISSHLQQKQRPQELQQFQQLKSLQHHDYQQINSTPGLSGNSTVAAVLSVQASSSSVLTLTAASTSVSSDAALTARTNTVKKELDKDVNFLYLKHVILKFMLSRETEAMQLIKAVSMLLNFTHQEQQLIRDTLEWKMSWFGHRPSLGEGQTAKVIPPAL